MRYRNYIAANRLRSQDTKTQGWVPRCGVVVPRAGRRRVRSQRVAKEKCKASGVRGADSRVGGLTVDCNARIHEGTLQIEAPLSAQRW